MKYYINNTTKEIINIRTFMESIKEAPNKQQLIEDFRGANTEYSDYNPIIHELENINFDFPFSVGAKQFKKVPLSLILENSKNKELWEGCPLLYNFEMLDCINEVINSGAFPYNSVIAELFCSKYGLGAFDDSFSFVSSMVYCCQQVRHSIDSEKAEKAFFEQITQSGYIKATKDILIGAIDTEKRFSVVLNGTNIFGSESKSVSEKKYKLKNWGEQGLHWVESRSRVKGYKAFEGQYIKILN